MSNRNFPRGLFAALLAAGVSSGCSASSDLSETAPPGENRGQESGDRAQTPADDAQKEEMLAGLSTEERAAVQKQRICPVSGGLLWSMARPYPVTVTAGDGSSRKVYLCCDGCEEALKGDPDTYLAKLAR